MNTTQTAIVSVIILAFVASLPGLYLYTEIDTGENNRQAQARPIATVEAELPEIPDSSELPQTNFSLVEKDQQILPTGNININTAGSRQLQQIRGVGPATADNIISYREQHGPFEDFHDLMGISGVGPGTVENFIGEINFGD